MHTCPVIVLNQLDPHPNADTLDIVQIGLYSCAVKKGEFRVGDLVVFLEPDTLVDTHMAQFQFLGDKRRIRPQRLRGLVSQGLLVPAPEGAPVDR